ncbi:WD repeat-containing protein 1 [Cladochytrium tenue]|nr:WD repeat-containing protein 1 [Cladochytrium tenue]
MTFNKSIKDHSRFVQCVRFSPSGDSFVSAGMDGKMFIYDGKTGDKISELTGASDGHTGGILSFSWSPDGKQILSCSGDTTAKIWDVAAKSVVTPNVVATNGVPNGIAATGPYVVVASGTGHVSLYQDDAIVFSKTFTWTPTAVAISPDAKYVAIGDEAKVVHIFSFSGDSLDEIQALNNNRGEITSLSFSPDGSMLASADRERTILVFDTAAWTVGLQSSCSSY